MKLKNDIVAKNQPRPKRFGSNGQWPWCLNKAKPTNNNNNNKSKPESLLMEYVGSD